MACLSKSPKDLLLLLWENLVLGNPLFCDSFTVSMILGRVKEEFSLMVRISGKDHPLPRPINSEGLS